MHYYYLPIKIVIFGYPLFSDKPTQMYYTVIISMLPGQIGPGFAAKVGKQQSRSVSYHPKVETVFPSVMSSS
jgi:hypothetical protein